MKAPRPIDYLCPGCNARPGEKCQPEGVTCAARHGLVNAREATKVARHQPTLDEQRRVAVEQEQIRRTLAAMKHRSTIGRGT